MRKRRVLKLILGIMVFSLVSCGTTKRYSKQTSSVKSTKEERLSKEEQLERKIYSYSDEYFEKFSQKNRESLNKYTLAYIEQYKDIAIEKMLEYQIPASITLAQGILESGNGRSELTRKANNHFGIKCHKGWRGKKVYHDDDRRHECFRKYDNPVGSFNDHSLFLTTRSRYAFLFDLKEGNYKGWAKGLKKAGYATDRKYPSKLIKLIEDYNLYAYDHIVIKNKKGNRYFDVDKELPSVASSKASKKYVIVKKGDTLYAIAKNNNITVQELKQLNNLKSNEIHINQKLYIKKVR